MCPSVHGKENDSYRAIWYKCEDMTKTTIMPLWGKITVMGRYVGGRMTYTTPCTASSVSILMEWAHKFMENSLIATTWHDGSMIVTKTTIMSLWGKTAVMGDMSGCTTYTASAITISMRLSSSWTAILGGEVVGTNTYTISYISNMTIRIT